MKNKEFKSRTKILHKELNAVKSPEAKTMIHKRIIELNNERIIFLNGETAKLCEGCPKCGEQEEVSVKPITYDCYTCGATWQPSEA